MQSDLMTALQTGHLGYVEVEDEAEIEPPTLIFGQASKKLNVSAYLVRVKLVT